MDRKIAVGGILEKLQLETEPCLEALSEALASAWSGLKS